MTIGAQPLRAAGASAGGWVRRAGYLQKWVVLGVAIGVIAGLGAAVFYWALSEATHLLLGGLAGYKPPNPLGEGGSAGTGHYVRAWAIPLVVCLGGLASGILVFSLAPEAEGHGTDAAIEAVNKNPRMIRARVVLVKIVASALTIGSGGSGGREGPTAQISAGFGSLLARTLDLSPEDGRIAVSVGIGSGIGAIFGAPLGGAVLAADIVYRDDFEVEALVPGLITSIVAYTIFGLIDGFSPLFGYAASGFQFHQPIQLAWFAVIGIVAGLVGLLYGKGFYAMIDLTHRLPGSRMIKPAVAGLLVGLLALELPQVLGTGYGWVQHSLDRQQLLAIPFWIVLALPLARILATSLSIGSGGSGGIFGPGMVIGAFVGAAAWRLLEPIAPGIPHSPAPFVIVGMMACFGSVARAPLAIMLMVAEMTGSLTILAPAMVAVGLAYLIVRRADVTIYRSQARNREEAQTSRLRFGLPLLARVRVADTMTPPRLVVHQDITAEVALRNLQQAQVPGAPVTDTSGRFIGVVSTDALVYQTTKNANTTISRLVDTTAATTHPDDDLDTALDALPDGQTWLPVVDIDRHLQGVLGIADIVRGYQTALASGARRLSGISRTGTQIADLQVSPDSTLVGQTLNTGQLPDGIVVVSIARQDAVLFGVHSTAIAANDTITVVGRPDRIDQARQLLSQSASTADGQSQTAKRAPREAS